MTTVTVDNTGKINLPKAALEESQIKAGAQLIVLVREGKIVLLDKEHFQHHLEKSGQEILDQFRHSLMQNPKAPFFGGLTFEEYTALSEEEEEALWERLNAEAEKELRHVKEIDIPAYFRPAGQKRR